MRKALCLIFYQALILASHAASAQQPPAIPELPPLVIDNFSPVVREQIQEAYANASARLKSDDAIGQLGMVLQTYGLFKEAAACYRLASQLAPLTFRWAYYLGVGPDGGRTLRRGCLHASHGHAPRSQLCPCTVTTSKLPTRVRRLEREREGLRRDSTWSHR